MTDEPADRPALETIRTGGELRRWTWRKPELEAHARASGLRHTGSKFTILDRIAHFLDSGETVWPGDQRSNRGPEFDWHSARLTPETVITGSYKNTQNVRRFFRAHAGADFKFNIAFMDWMRKNSGKTLADALAEYHRRRAQDTKKSDGSERADNAGQD